MNKEPSSSAQPEASHYRSLQILDELANNDTLTQRDLSQRLGIALGLVNSYVKNLVAKGYITVKNIPPKRYAYYLTPKGFAEKTRLAYDLLSDYTRIYREAKSNFRKLFLELENDGVKRIAFAGADEVAEIAFITLQESTIELLAIADDTLAGNAFFGRDILPIDKLKELPCDAVIITSYVDRQRIRERLALTGISSSRIYTVFVETSK